MALPASPPKQMAARRSFAQPAGQFVKAERIQGDLLHQMRLFAVVLPGERSAGSRTGRPPIRCRVNQLHRRCGGPVQQRLIDRRPDTARRHADLARLAEAKTVAFGNRGTGEPGREPQRLAVSVLFANRTFTSTADLRICAEIAARRRTEAEAVSFCRVAAGQRGVHRLTDALLFLITGPVPMGAARALALLPLANARAALIRDLASVAHFEAAKGIGLRLLFSSFSLALLRGVGRFRQPGNPVPKSHASETTQDITAGWKAGQGARQGATGRDSDAGPW